MSQVRGMTRCSRAIAYAASLSAVKISTLEYRWRPSRASKARRLACVKARSRRIWRHPAEVCVDPVEHCSQTHVRGAFRWSEIQVQRDRIEAGEEPPGQVGYGELENGRPHELGETG